MKQFPPLHGEKPGDYRYWPTVKAFEVVGERVPVFIVERDREAQS